MRSIMGYKGKFISMKNRVKWQVLFAVFTSLFLVIVFVPQLGRASTSGQPAMPLSISPISDNDAGFAITSLGKANANKYTTHGKRVATNGVVASLSPCSVIRSHHRFFSRVGNFVSHFRAFRKACLILDLPPPIQLSRNSKLFNSV